LVEPDAQLQRSGRKAAFLLAAIVARTASVPDDRVQRGSGADMISLCGNPEKIQRHPGIIADQ
jgi:hypothetical protein